VRRVRRTLLCNLVSLQYLDYALSSIVWKEWQCSGTNEAGGRDNTDYRGECAVGHRWYVLVFGR
jgi:hypothetical protein